MFASSILVVVIRVTLASPAAAESLVTFQTTTVGSTAVTAADPPTFPAVQDLSLSGGNIATTVPASTTLTETFATGATWSITAQICGPDNYTTPTTSDCADFPNQLVRARGNAPADSLAGSAIGVTRGSPVVSGDAVGTASAGTQATLGSPVTLLTSAESATTTYGGYSVTTGLSVNNLTRIGTWKGYWIITQTT